MPTELIKEFMGKVCAIVLFNDSFGVTGKIVAVEQNWIKVEEKNKVRLINVDMIREMSTMMTAERALQSAAQVLKLYDGLLTKAANELARM